MYTSATVIKGGHRKSMIAFWVKIKSTKKFQNSKLWENLSENLGVREDRPDHDQPWIFPLMLLTNKKSVKNEFIFDRNIK